MGASNGQALRAATINGATVCGIEERTGSLEPGKYADMLAVKGNPFEDISALKNVVAVIKKGGIVNKEYDD
jgi:imidazolonepropionase-like amidohydrolase